MRLWVDTAACARTETLFGVAAIERLRRSAGPLGGDTSVVLSGPSAESQNWPGAALHVDAGKLGGRLRLALADGPLVALDGANVIDPRLIKFLLRASGSCLAARGEGAQRAVALRLAPDLREAIPADADTLLEVADALSAAGLIAPLDEREFPAFIDKLRRSLPYWIYAVNDAATRRRLERQMFWDNYKGSTDLLTRYVYPPLVWPLVRVCIRRFGTSPSPGDWARAVAMTLCTKRPCG
jgi:hypothetical protein